jgi:hypothetical protein
LTNRGCCSICFGESWERRRGLLIEPSQSTANLERIVQPQHVWKPKSVEDHQTWVKVKADGA